MSRQESLDAVTTVVPKIFKNVAQVSFSWYDYLLFCVMLGLSALIGIYFGCFGTKQSTAKEYLMGNKKMKVLPISVSLVASHISGITLLAVPADVYRYGAGYWLFILAILIVAPCTIYVYLPVFFKLQITSTYEYLERRFNSTTRMFASFLFTLGLCLYLPVVIYIPALALSAATGINIHYITPVVCGVCIFYTTLGGLKAVVWTDTLQFTVTVGAVLTVAIIGVKSGGGFAEIWTKALEGHRLDIFDFNPDPTVRDGFWAVTIGLTVFWTSLVAVHQSCVQKFLAVSTFREAKLAVIYFCIGIILISSLSVFIGLIMYARYAQCDPFTLGTVQKNDQLLPYYIMDVASHIPGLSGLFIAGIFCAALSTLSASLNCLAGTVYEDFILKITGPIQDEKKTAFILKVIVVVGGIFCTAMVYIVEKLGSLVALSAALGGVTGGPLFGMFTLGILFPKASSKGVYYGTIIGLLASGAIVTMNQYYKTQGLIPDIPRPTSIEECPTAVPDEQSFTLQSEKDFLNYTTTAVFTNEQILNNVTTLPLLNDTVLQTADDKPFFLFRLSHWYNAPLGGVLTIVAGLLISYLTKNEDPPVHRDLLSPVIYFLLPDENLDKNKDYYTLDKALQMVTTNAEDHEKAKT